MNKTININLGGSFFHIDEVAYKKLQRYLDAVRRSLSDDPKGRDEILSDIELRIGELLSEKIKDVRQVINENDINEVIEIMGKPEDYMVDEEVFSDNYTEYQHRRSKKLYRDGDDKFLGGVSSGMAHYFNVDVIWVRIAWLVAAFGFGFGFLVYIILWILLPEANTTTEKLEMMGEQVNISNIEKKIKEELEEASERIKSGINDVSEKVKNADYEKYSSKAKSGMQDFLDTLGNIITALFMVTGKFIGILLIIISAVTILGLLISLFTVGSLDFVHDGWFFENAHFYNNSGLPIWIVSILAFLLVGIPFFFLFLLGMRILSNNTKTIGNTARLSLLGIWLVALLATTFFGSKVLMQKAFHSSVTESQDLFFANTDTLSIKLLDNEKLSNHSVLKYRWESDIVLDEENDKRMYSNHIRLNILSTEDEAAFLKIKKRSKGKSQLAARENAASIEYELQILDKDILLNGYFLSEIENQFKEQTMNIDLYIPEGQVIYLDKSTRSFLSNVDNIQDIYDKDMAKHYFKMTEEGLYCLDCEEMNLTKTKSTEITDPESFNMKINEDGVHIEIVDENKEKAEVKIDESGISVESSKDTI
ncbi:MAG: PspC domain-containing protein [Bacteroidota bacterium]